MKKKRKICTFKLENSFLGWKCFPLFCVCTMYYMCSDSLSKKCLADWSLWWGWTDILQNIFRYFTGFCLCERIIKKWNTFFSIHTNFLLYIAKNHTIYTWIIRKLFIFRWIKYSYIGIIISDFPSSYIYKKNRIHIQWIHGRYKIENSIFHP